MQLLPLHSSFQRLEEIVGVGVGVVGEGLELSLDLDLDLDQPALGEGMEI